MMTLMIVSRYNNKKSMASRLRRSPWRSVSGHRPLGSIFYSQKENKSIYSPWRNYLNISWNSNKKNWMEVLLLGKRRNKIKLQLVRNNIILMWQQYLIWGHRLWGRKILWIWWGIMKSMILKQETKLLMTMRLTALDRIVMMRTISITIEVIPRGTMVVGQTYSRTMMTSSRK